MRDIYGVHFDPDESDCPLPGIERAGTLEDCLAYAWRCNYYERMQTADYVVAEIELGEVCYYWVESVDEPFLEARP